MLQVSPWRRRRHWRRRLSLAASYQQFQQPVGSRWQSLVHAPVIFMLLLYVPFKPHHAHVFSDVGEGHRAGQAAGQDAREPHV